MMDTWRIEPSGTDVRRTRTTAMVMRHPDEGVRDRLVRNLNWKINGLVMDEDVELCDGVQEGLEALTYERGVLNATENAVANFHDLLREAVPGIDDA
jgi:phenylpropionate dioxygenase-like ring-hydroxylating dioxygenase large terminal subunit